MAVVAVKHNKVVTIPDDPNYPVGSNEWNDVHSVTGLENVDNTSDVNKPVSTAQQAAINAGVASVTKTSIGLGNVDNTSDANKPLSTADVAALALKAPLASPSFTGTVQTPNLNIGGSAFATPFVLRTNVNENLAIFDGGSGSITIEAVNDANNANTPLAIFASTLSLNGTVTAPTPPTADNSTKVATTAYVKAQAPTGPLYASNFGVVGDGVTDNTAAYVTAMAAFPASGGTLIMPPGICIGVMNVTKPVIVQGQGMGRVGASTGTAGTELRSAGAADNILTFSANGGGARDLLITSSVAAVSRTGAGLKIGSIQGIEVRNVVSNGHKYGIWNTAPGNTFIQCYGNGNQTAGLYLDGSAFDQSEIEVLDCQFNSNVGSGVQIGGHGIGIFTKRLTCANNSVSGVVFLASSTISDLYFDQPEISSNASHGIDASLNTGTNLSISGGGVVEVVTGTGDALVTGSGQSNVVLGSGTTFSGTGQPAIQIGGAHTVVSGVIIQGGQATGYAFSVTATASDFNINGNTFQHTGTAGNGLLINAGATDGLVSANKFVGFSNNITNNSTGTIIISGGLHTNETTASTSTTTGALTVPGGAGIAGQVSANNLSFFAPVSATPVISALNTAVSVAAAGNQTFNTTSASNLVWFLIRENTTTGDWVQGLATSGGVTIFNQSAGVSYSVTTTPAAGKYGIAYDGAGNYKIYNGAVGAKLFSALTLAL